jgi:hypothetical protein
MLSHNQPSTANMIVNKFKIFHVEQTAHGYLKEASRVATELEVSDAL